MSAGTNDRFGLLRQVDLLVLLGALLALFVALGSEHWWTLTGTTTSNLLTVQVSPFYLHINAIGLPSTTALANNLGIFTRLLLILGSLALFAGSIQPTAWWRNLAVYFGLSSLVELYFSFIMIFYWRSEEHTSELQSQSNLVCRLLLEKKKHIRLSRWSSRACGSRPWAKTPPMSSKRR